jgi:hypothetical protein
MRQSRKSRGNEREAGDDIVGKERRTRMNMDHWYVWPARLEYCKGVEGQNSPPPRFARFLTVITVTSERPGLEESHSCNCASRNK